MERPHMNHLRDLIHRLLAGESERRIARDFRISWPTVHMYHLLAKREGYLKAGKVLPDDATLLGAGAWPAAPQERFQPGTLSRGDENLLKQNVEMTAIW